MGGQNVDGKYMNDLNSSFGRSVNINCDTISMPGKDMQTQEVQYGSEPTRSMVQTHAYAGTNRGILLCRQVYERKTIL